MLLRSKNWPASNRIVASAVTYVSSQIDAVMKNLIALVFGLALISAAIIIAERTTSLDTGPRPLLAAALATEWHLTPSATPTASPTPTLTPTPVHLAVLKPQPAQVLAKLFQYPYEGTALSTATARVYQQQLYTREGVLRLLVTGDRLIAGRGMQVASGAFGAVMSWNNGEYAITYLRVMLAHGDIHAWLARLQDGTVTFRFGGGPELGPGGVQHTFVVHPCNAPGYPATPGAHSDDDECY